MDQALFLRMLAIPRISVSVVGAALLLAGAQAALACACCTHPTQRVIATEKLDSFHLGEIARLRFAGEAKLLLGEANDEGLPGMPEPEEDWALSVKRQKDRLIFSLRDAKGSAGTLTLVLPKSLSAFMTDTRDAENKGFGPSLYAEWTLTSPFSSDGIFRPAASQSRRLTLILQGRGSACTDAETFTHWTLNFGQAGQYRFYGALTAPNP
jgi:hypothetical protein